MSVVDRVSIPAGEMDCSTPAIVFRADNYASLGIVRSLGRLGIEVYCVDHDPDALAAKSKYCTQRLDWNFEREKEEDSVAFLIGFARSLGRKPVLIPTFDTRNLLVDRFREQLAPWFLLPQPAPGALSSLYGKRSMYELCLQHGIPTPRTAFPDSIERAVEASAAIGFPLVIKAIDGDRLMRRTGRRMALVGDQVELAREYAKLDEPGVANLALQEFIPGTVADSSWMLSAYFDSQSRSRFVITGRKLRQLPVGGGLTTFGACADCEAIRTSIAALVQATRFHGIIDADYIHDRRDGQWKLLDVNPRPGANFRLFVDRNGLDCVRAMYLDLTGQAIPAVEPKWGRKWMVEDSDLSAFVQMLRLRRTSPGAWLKSLAGEVELAYCALDDLRPSAHFLKKFLGGKFGGLLGRVRR